MQHHNFSTHAIENNAKILSCRFSTSFRTFPSKTLTLEGRHLKHNTLKLYYWSGIEKSVVKNIDENQTEVVKKKDNVTKF